MLKVIVKRKDTSVEVDMTPLFLLYLISMLTT